MRITVFLRPVVVLAIACIVSLGYQRQVDAAATKTVRDSGAGILMPAAKMASARAVHTATTLADGRVLLAGGFTEQENIVAGVEIHDPVSGKSTSMRPMRTPRHSHTATLLPHGKVLLAGGYNARGEYLGSAEIFDPATGMFTPAGSMSRARAEHVAVQLKDGRVLFIGGVGEGWSFLSSAELYDPATATFASTGAMRVPRTSHAAVRLADGRVLVVGGNQGRRAAVQLYTSAEVYDPATGAFAPVGDMAVRRHKHDAVLLEDGRVLITGGSDERDSDGVYTSAELFDPRTRAFRTTGAMRLPRYKHRGTSVVLPDRRVLLAGGATRAELYDPGTGTFSLVGDEARLAGQFSASTPLSNGRVLITGGYDGKNLVPQAATWVYQP